MRKMSKGRVKNEQTAYFCELVTDKIDILNLRFQ